MLIPMTVSDAQRLLDLATQSLRGELPEDARAFWTRVREHIEREFAFFEDGVVQK